MRLPGQDLAAVVRSTAPLWGPLRGGRILVTGATGFFGCWLLESLVAANRELGLGLAIFAQSRDPGRFLQRVPHLGPAAGIQWLAVAPAELSLRPFGAAGLDAIVHLVTEADNAATLARPVDALDTIVGSTRKALDLAVAARARYFLYPSSGAVYARPPGWREQLPETHALAADPADLSSPYGFSGGLKRQAEQGCAAYARQHGLNATIARCFTFVGPQLPLRGKFALGNFLDDALHGRDIVIQGDGTPVRSYLYAADLAGWLWTIMLRGQAGRAYNVGSGLPLTLREAAEIVRHEVAPDRGVRVLGQSGAMPSCDCYWPDITRAAQELGLRESVPLAAGVRRTADWWRACVQC